MNFKKIKRLLANKNALLLVLLGILLLSMCQQRHTKRELQALKQAHLATSDTLQSVRNKRGEELAFVRTVEGNIRKMMTLNADKDAMTAALKRQLADYERQLQTATAVQVQTKVVERVPIIIKDTLVKIIYKDAWVDVQATQVSKDSADIALQVTNDLTIWHATQKQGWFKPPKTYVYFQDQNPHSEFKAARSYIVPTPQMQRLGIGLTAGIGISTDKQLRPSLGIGAFYRLW